MNKNSLIPLPLLLFALAFSLLLPVLQQFKPILLYHRDAVLAGEAWRLLTGNLVHTNDYHLYLNLAGLWVFLLLCGSVITIKLLISSIFISGISIGCALLLLHPEIRWYAGLSGVLYGLFIIGSVCLALTGEIFSFCALLALIFIKLGSVWLGETDDLTQNMIQAKIIDEAHIYGAIAGFLTATPLSLKRLKQTV